MKRVFTVTLATVALLGGILLVVLSPARGALQQAPAAAQEQPQSQPDAVAPLEGIYAGQVQMSGVVKAGFGVPFRTPVPPATGTPTPDLGNIDLALFLRQSGTNVNGYVGLDATLIFTRTGTVIQATPIGYPTGQPAPALTPIAIGPSVTGTFHGTTLVLNSAEQKMNTDTNLTLLRQFRIVAKLQPGKGQVFEGDYFETFTGFQDANSVSGDAPLTAYGHVMLYSTLYVPRDDTPTPTPTQPGGATPTPTGTPTSGPPPGGHDTYLPVILRP